MRRFIAYSIISAALLGVAAVSFTPVITSMNTDVAYADGKTLTFRVSNSSEDNEYDYYNPSDQNATPFTEEENGNDIEDVAEMLEGRLANWDLSEYSVETVGYDTINVTLLPTYKDDTEYERIEKYLTFSGGDLSLNVNNQSYTAVEFSDTNLDVMLDGVSAYIEYIETSSGGSSYPVVLMDIDDDYKDYLINEAGTGIIDYCTGNYVEDDETTEDDDESRSVTLILWGNLNEEIDYSERIVNSSNPNTESRIIYETEVTQAGDAVYYDDDDDDQEYPYFMMVPTTIDSSNASDPYREACYLVNMVNAEEFVLDNGTEFKVDYLYSTDAAATVENLIDFGDWTRSVAMSATFISVLVAYLVTCVVVALFLRASAIASIGVSTFTVFSTLFLFVATGAQFNVAALLALAVVGLISLFGQILYHSKLKDELYKGRTLKKANQEAGKRSFFPTLDASIVSIIVGIFVYMWAGDLASKIGIILIIGGFLAGLFNLAVYRFLMWMLCADDTMQSSYPKMLGLDSTKIPDLLKEERQTYFGAFAEKDFTKGKKWVSIFSGLIVLAGIVTMSVFGSLNGTVYNDTSTSDTETVLLIESRTSAYSSDTTPDVNTASFSSVDDIYLTTAGNNSLLASIYYSGGSLGSYYSDTDSVFDSIVSSDSYKTTYDADSGENGVYYYWFYWKVTLPINIDLTADYEEGTFGVYRLDGSLDNSYSTLNEAIDAYIGMYYSSTQSSSATSLLISAKTVTPSEGTPYLANVALGLSIGVILAGLYMVLRYRPSRGIVAGLISFGSTFMALSFFVFTRMSVTPIVAVGCAAVAMLSYLISIYMLSTEKDVAKDIHDRSRTALDIRSEAITKANSYAAGEMIMLTLLAAYIAICFFAFGPNVYASIYLNFVLGLVFAIALNLALLAPSAKGLAKFFSKLFTRKKKKKKPTVGQLQQKSSRSAEPEEAIFIGIND